VIGQGNQFSALKRAAGPTVKLLGWADDISLKDYYSRCRALVFIADEDFGIVPVEAMSAGRPVIAWSGGGVLETVRHGESGVLFPYQTAESLITAVHEFERTETSFDSVRIAEATHRFAKHLFKEQFDRTICSWLAERREAARRIREPLKSSPYTALSLSRPA
jgi:glycosyltransferase involved in cell wall biosynthesis